MVDYKKIATALGLGYTLSVSTAHALGVGKLNVLSHLGEPLDVAIDLTSVSGGELSTLSIGLAPRSEFERLGIAYPDNAPNLIFEIENSGNGGAPQIRIRSDNAVDSSFLHLLLQIEWAGGSILREYTALIDPLDIEPNSISASSSDSAQIATQSASTPSSVTGEAQQYGPIRAGESLSSVVNNFLPSGVTRYQGWLAVYEANPEAFYQGKLNALIRGAYLQIPSRDVMLSVSAEQARSQTDELSQRTTRVRPQAKPNKVKVQKPPPVGSSDSPRVAKDKKVISPKADPKPVGSQPAIVDTKVMVSTPDLSAIKTQLTEFKQSNNLSRSERNKLNQRISNLESQLSRIATLLEKQSKALEEIQKRQVQKQDAANAPDVAQSSPNTTSSAAGRVQTPALPKIGVDQRSEGIRGTVAPTQSQNNTQASKQTNTRGGNQQAKLPVPKIPTIKKPVDQKNTNSVTPKPKIQAPSQTSAQTTSESDAPNTSKTQEAADRKRRLAEVDAAIQEKLAEMRAKSANTQTSGDNLASDQAPQPSIVSENSINTPSLDAPRYVRQDDMLGSVTKVFSDLWPMLSKVLGALALGLLAFFGWKKFGGSSDSKSSSPKSGKGFRGFSLPKRKSGRKTEEELAAEVEREFESLSAGSDVTGDVSMFDQETIGLGSSALDLGEDSQLVTSMLDSMSLESGLDSGLLKSKDSSLNSGFDSGFSSFDQGPDSSQDNSKQVSSSLNAEPVKNDYADLKMSGLTEVLGEDSVSLSSDSGILLDSDTVALPDFKLDPASSDDVKLSIDTAEHITEQESVFSVGGQESIVSSLESVGANLSQQTAYSQGVEVDPIAEAEVYLAYERKNQAIQVLQSAYKKDPTRHVLGLKLLGIYKDSNDSKAFEALASKMKQHDDPDSQGLWDKISSMGASFIPSSALFAGVAALSTVARTAPAPESSEALLTQDSQALGNDISLSLEDEESIDNQTSSKLLFKLEDESLENKTRADAVKISENQPVTNKLESNFDSIDVDIQNSLISPTSIDQASSDSGDVLIDTDKPKNRVDGKSKELDSGASDSPSENKQLSGDSFSIGDSSLSSFGESLSFSSIDDEVDGDGDDSLDTTFDMREQDVAETLSDSVIEPLTDSLFDLDDEELVKRKRQLEQELVDIDSIMGSSLLQDSSLSHLLSDSALVEPALSSDMNSELITPSFAEGNGDGGISGLFQSDADTAMTELEIDSKLLDSSRAANSALGRGESFTDSQAEESTLDSSQLEINQHDPDTALALAKAYVELGEMDIAKDFLDDVIRDGNEEQIAEATAMAASI